jgi:hypothetical protein
VIGGRFEDGGGFMIVETGDAGGEGDPHGDAGLSEGTHGLEAEGGTGGTGLKGGSEMAIEGGEGDEDGGGLNPGQFAEEIDVAGDEVVLGDNGDGVAELREDFEATAGDLEFSLDGLVGIGHPAADEGFGLPAGAIEFAGEEFGSVFFDHEAGFEIETGVEPEVFVVGTGVTVGATVFAASIGIEAGLHGDIGAGVGGDDGPGVVPVAVGAGGGGLEIGIDPLKFLEGTGVEFDVESFEAISGGVSDAAAFWGEHEKIILFL